jgi:hypothetical protein
MVQQAYLAHNCRERSRSSNSDLPEQRARLGTAQASFTAACCDGDDPFRRLARAMRNWWGEDKAVDVTGRTGNRERLQAMVTPTTSRTSVYPALLLNVSTRAPHRNPRHYRVDTGTVPPLLAALVKWDFKQAADWRTP